MTGKKCDKCSTADQYVGNATGETGTCFYPLLISYQYTFTLSATEDASVTSINFLNVSQEKDDIDFTIHLKVRSFCMYVLTRTSEICFY